MKLRRKRRPRSTSEQLKMTSLMDILVVLLLFLLKSFVVEGDVITPAHGVELPESTSEEPPEESLVVAVSSESIRLGGEVVTEISSLESGEELVIESLADALDDTRAQREHITEITGTEMRRLVSIQADRGTEFRILERVMYTLNRAGYEDLSLAVIQES